MHGIQEWIGWGLVGLPLALIASYPLHAWIAFRSARTTAPSMPGGRVSVIVPLRGEDAGLQANLSSLLDQESLGDYEVLLCVEGLSDGAVPVLEELLARDARRRARLVLSGPSGRELGKLHNLMAGVTEATGSILVFVDSDARLPSRTYLAGFIAPLSRPGVGGVTCYPIYRGGRNAGALLLAGWINVDLWGTFAVRAAWTRGGFANGACMALRRDTLARCGGLESLRRRLLMDSRLAERIGRLGLRVVVHPTPVPIERDRASLREAWEQSTRWHVALYRGLHPVAWAVFAWLRSTLTLAAGYALLAPGSPAARGILAAALGIRVALAVGAPGASRRFTDMARRALAQPFADLLGTVAWIEAMARPSVRWRGRRYRVGRDGTLGRVQDGFDPPPAKLEQRASGASRLARESDENAARTIHDRVGSHGQDAASRVP